MVPSEDQEGPIGATGPGSSKRCADQTEDKGAGKRPKDMEVSGVVSEGLTFARDDLTFHLGPAQSPQRKKHLKVKRQSTNHGRGDKSQGPAIVDGGEMLAGDSLDVNLSFGFLSMAEGAGQNMPPPAMRIFYWNCWGLGNPRTVNALRSWLGSNCPNIVFLMETMLDALALERVKHRCGFENGLCLASSGRSGGLGFWWRDVEVHIKAYSSNFVYGEVLDNTGNPSWGAVGIYGWPEAVNECRTWNLMQTLKNSTRLPLVFFGDFNQILYERGKDDGPRRRNVQMQAYRDIIDECGLHD